MVVGPVYQGIRLSEDRHVVAYYTVHGRCEVSTNLRDVECRVWYRKYLQIRQGQGRAIGEASLVAQRIFARDETKRMDDWARTVIAMMRSNGQLLKWENEDE